MVKTIVYNGNNLYKDIQFGLYDLEDIDFEASKKAIEEGFVHDCKEQLVKVLSEAGLKYEGVNYFSPRAYNYSNDSLDLIISIEDKNKLINFIKSNSYAIEAKMQENKGYDGYFATTRDNVQEELLSMEQEDYEPDILVIQAILDKYDFFHDFDVSDYMVYQDSNE